MRALICGISGQDGAYLAKLLLSKGYEVIGVSRDAQVSSFANLAKVGIRRDQLVLTSMAPTDFRSVLHTMKRYAPEQIYNLSGQSSVGLSFEQPVETLESIASATQNILEAIRFLDLPTRFYNAGSSECFGETPGDGATEATPFKPRSPYGVAKSTAFWQVANYREAYSIQACTGILFNHESPLRADRFVTRKIVAAACRIKSGSRERLRLGDVMVARDWGWAPEYVEAMWRMVTSPHPVDDYVIATGTTFLLKDFVREVFERLELDWQEHTDVDPTLFRPSDIRFSRGNPEKARRLLGWSPVRRMKDVVGALLAAELETQPAFDEWRLAHLPVDRSSVHVGGPQ